MAHGEETFNYASLCSLVLNSINCGNVVQSYGTSAQGPPVIPPGSLVLSLSEFISALHFHSKGPGVSLRSIPQHYPGQPDNQLVMVRASASTLHMLV